MTKRLPISVARYIQNYVHVLHTEFPANLIEGVYIYGSISLGAFNEEKSDVDFIVLLKRNLNKQEVEAIRAVHSQMNESEFGRRMDGIYVQVSSLGKTNEELQPYPYCSEGQINIGHWDVNHITWWLLKKHGITLKGTPITELVIPTEWNHVLETLKYNINQYWFSKTSDEHISLPDEMVEWATCTICRILCSLEQQNILSKDEAIKASLESLPESWHLLLKEAARIRQETSPNSFYTSELTRTKECRDFILYAHQLCNEKYFVGEWNMEIKQLTATDARAYWDLRLEALQKNPEAFGSSYEEAIKRENPLDTVATNLSTEGNYTYGAFHNGELVGMLTLLKEQSLKLKHRANILAVYVSPHARTLGVGKALLSEAINKAKSIEEIEKINLTVVSSNEAAKKLYEKFGFKVFGVEEKALKVNDQYYTEDHMTLIL